MDSRLYPPGTNAFDIILATMKQWATANAEKIYYISKTGPWEGWVQAELAYDLTAVIIANRPTDVSDAFIKHEREEFIWTGVHKQQRVDLLMGYGNTNFWCPLNAIELKCIASSAQFFALARANIEKQKESVLNPTWYRLGGLNLRAGGFTLQSKLAVPQEFNKGFAVPVPKTGENIVCAFWVATVEKNGRLGPFLDSEPAQPTGSAGGSTGGSSTGPAHGTGASGGPSARPGRGLPTRPRGGGAEEEEGGEEGGEEEEEEGAFDMHHLRQALPHPTEHDGHYNGHCVGHALQVPHPADDQSHYEMHSQHAGFADPYGEEEDEDEGHGMHPHANGLGHPGEHDQHEGQHYPYWQH